MKYVEEVSISIHALLAESDPCAWYAPAGAHISIHALLAESDTDRMFCSRQRLNFYPRSPCGERPALKTIKALFDTISIHALLAESDSKEGAMADFDKIFLSTLSLRRATSAPAGKRAGRYYFYPRSPCGERPAYRVQLGSIVSISIHALLAESDHQPRQTSHCKKLFLSTLSLRRATWPRVMVSPTLYFYPRSPCGERR